MNFKFIFTLSIIYNCSVLRYLSSCHHPHSAVNCTFGSMKLRIVGNFPLVHTFCVLMGTRRFIGNISKLNTHLSIDCKKPTVTTTSAFF